MPGYDEGCINTFYHRNCVGADCDWRIGYEAKGNAICEERPKTLLD